MTDTTCPPIHPGLTEIFVALAPDCLEELMQHYGFDGYARVIDLMLRAIGREVHGPLQALAASAPTLRRDIEQAFARLT